MLFNNCFCVLLWCKTFRYFMGSSHVCCYLFLVYWKMRASLLHHDSKVRYNFPTGNVLELGFPKCFQLVLYYLWKDCSLPNAILKKIWEMTRNLGAHPAWLLPFFSLKILLFLLSYSKTQKYCYPCYYFLTPNFKILLTCPKEFFWVSNPTYVFWI